jgi:hypothetical protein
MDHPDEEVFLLGIWEEFDKPLAAVMTDHGEAGTFVRLSVICFHLNEAPVHLVSFAGTCLKAPAAVALRISDKASGRKQILMFLQVHLDLCLPSGVTVLSELFQADSRIADIVPEKIIQNPGISGENSDFRLFVSAGLIGPFSAG